MLTADLALCWRKGKTTGPRTIDARDAEMLDVARDLIEVVDAHRQKRKSALDRALDDYVGAGTDYKVIRGLTKLLLDRCTFVTSSRVDPTEIRRTVFRAARGRHPAIRGTESWTQTIAEASAALGMAPDALVESLYGDLEDNQHLADFEPIEPQALLDEYNLAQAQALLYRAVAMELFVAPQSAAGYRKLFGAIKAYRLIHTIEGDDASGYRVRLDGPVSMFHRSQKYGIQMAVFLPALLQCEGWRMRAEIEDKWAGTVTYDLDSRQTEFRPPEEGYARDQSAVVEKLLNAWKADEGEPTIAATREVVNLGTSVFVPDAAVRYADESTVYVEVLGFWTPRSLESRLAEFERAGFTDFVLAASEEFMASRDAPSKVPANVVIFKSSLAPKAVRAAADAARRA